MYALKKFDYNLPKELIAQEPMKPRDHSRLLVFDKKTGELQDKHFYGIVYCLRAGDVLVLNNSKVFPARLIGKRKETGGKVEVFLLNKIYGKLWQCLIRGPRRKTGLEVEFEKGLKCVIIKDNQDGTWEVKFNRSGKVFMDTVEKIGRTPLPPYIKRLGNRRQALGDRKNYQTVYADDKRIGSVAAPTAGFHFTPRLIKKLKKMGVQFEYITLHVGLGTFAPVKVSDITKHKMHAEYVEVKKSVLARIIKAKQEGRRIIAVGTTSARTLEAVFFQIPNNKFQITNKFKIQKSPAANRAAGQAKFKNINSWVDIFIYPGFKFKMVDAMITNFHLPKSTLLMLVSAFAGKENIDKAYEYAIKNSYRFYSYGDAMFIY